MKRCYNKVDKLITEVDGMSNINRTYRNEVIDELKEIKKIIFGKMILPITDNEDDILSDEDDILSDEDENEKEKEKYNEESDNEEDTFLLKSALQRTFKNAISQGTEKVFYEQKW